MKDFLLCWGLILGLAVALAVTVALFYLLLLLSELVFIGALFLAVTAAMAFFIAAEPR